MPKRDRAAYQTGLMALLKGRMVAYYPRLAHLIGGVKAAVMLSQLLYWSIDEIVIKRKGWILKSVREFETETGLTQLEQATARDILMCTGVIEAHLSGIPRIWHYRVNEDRLTEILIDPQTQSMGKPLNGKGRQRSSMLRINIERDCGGTFTRKDAQFNNESNITDSYITEEITSSSYRGDSHNQEEEVTLSVELTQALDEISVFDNVRDEILKSGIPDEVLLKMVEQVRQAQEAGKTSTPGALFSHRLRQLIKHPRRVTRMTSTDRDRAERARYAAALSKWGIDSGAD